MGTQFRLPVIALLALAPQAVYATSFQEVTSFYGCFQDQQNTTGAPLSVSGHCASGGAGGTGAALADIGNGELGALASSNGFGNAGAHAQFLTNLYFLPNQEVPLTVTMHFTGAIIGGQASGPNNNEFLFQAAVMNNGLMFGVTGQDTKLLGFQVITNGQSGQGSFVDAVVTATGSVARDHVDLTLTFSKTYDVGASGETIPIGGYIEAQDNPAVIGDSSSVDFLDPATVSFEVPAGIQFTSDGFLATPEPTTLLLLSGGIAGLVLFGRSKRG